MELFEILFILLFILFPLLDGLRRGRKKQEPGIPEDVSGAPGRRPSSPDAEQYGSGGPASDMLPDDLWEILTGERRDDRYDEEHREEEAAAEAWAEPVATMEAPDPRDTEWADPDEDGPLEPEVRKAEPVSRWTEAWEAGLEKRELPTIVSLETPLASPEVRHRLFHQKLEEEAPPPVRRPSWIATQMARPGGMRQAVVLREVLGPPKGLD